MNVNPDALDIENNGIDEDCSGQDLVPLCATTCSHTDENGVTWDIFDGVCSDGGSGSVNDYCELGTDCIDCGFPCRSR